MGDILRYTPVLRGKIFVNVMCLDQSRASKNILEIASVFLLGFKIRTMNRDVFPQLSFENGSKPNGIIAKKTKPDGKAKTTGFGMNRKLTSTNQFCKHDM